MINVMGFLPYFWTLAGDPGINYQSMTESHNAIFGKYIPENQALRLNKINCEIKNIISDVQHDNIVAYVYVYVQCIYVCVCVYIIYMHLKLKVCYVEAGFVESLRYWVYRLPDH